MPMLQVPQGQDPQQFQQGLNTGLMGMMASPLQVKGPGVPGSRSFEFDKVRKMMQPGEEEFMMRRFGMDEDKWIRSIAEDRVRNAMAARNFDEVSKVSKDLSNMGKAYAKAREQVVKLLMTIKNPMTGGK